MVTTEKIFDADIREANTEDLVVWASMEKKLCDPLNSDEWQVHEDNYDRICKELRKRGKKCK
jgi:hypothetical protein